MGNTDRIVRTLLAIIAVALYLTGTVPGTLGIILIVLAAVFLLTSLVSFCPLYLPFGLSTCKKINIFGTLRGFKPLHASIECYIVVHR